MAESLQFSIGADTAGFQSGIGGILTGLAGLAAAFVSVQAVVSAFSDAIDMGGRLNDLSTRTGETAGNLAILERAFENTSVGADKLGPAIAKMQKNMVEMAQGSEEAVKAFTQLGLSWDDLKDKTPAEQMQLIGERLAAIHDPALRAETAIKIFGKSGSELIPILVNFSSEMEQAKSQLGSLPDQLDKTASSVDALGDDLHAIRNKLTEMAYGFLSEVVPAVEAFTKKLSGIDAAGLGAGLADALVAAFAQPMKAADLMGDLFLVGAKRMGNELVFQAQYWADTILKTLGIVGSEIIPMLGDTMTGAFAVSVGLFGKSLAAVLEPVADFFGADFVKGLKEGSEDLMVQGFAKITDSANAFQSAMAEAQKHSTVVRQDIFGAEESSDKIKANFAELKESTKAAVDILNTSVFSSSEMAASRTTTGVGVDPLTNILINENLVKQEPEGKEVKGKTITQAQVLQTIGGANLTQVIGMNASARRAQDLQKQIDLLTAEGKVGTPQWAAAQNALSRNLDVAFGNNLTSAEQDQARQLARDQWFTDTSQSLADLEKGAMEEMKLAKQANDPEAVKEQRAKAQAAGAGGKAGAPEMSIRSIVQAIQSILQKIEPKIPQHIMR
jgi:hypothetical protein